MTNKPPHRLLCQACPQYLVGRIAHPQAEQHALVAGLVESFVAREQQLADPIQRVFSFVAIRRPATGENLLRSWSSERRRREPPAMQARRGARASPRACLIAGAVLAATLTSTVLVAGEPTTASAASTGGLNVIVSERGRITPSLDANGSEGPVGSLTVDKPAGGTVRRAVLFAATTGYSDATMPGPVLLAGPSGSVHSVDMLNGKPSGISSSNYWTDVTTVLKSELDSAPSGAVAVTVTEPSPDYSVDGTLLAVIFDDPSQPADRSVSLLFGALLTEGDQFSLSLEHPYDPADPSSTMEMSLGISFSCQLAGACGAQYSEVDVNGQRLTSAAGGEDDGRSSDGALITVGGVGDSMANPADPWAQPTEPRSDDELYDLRPFLAAGDTSIRVDTRNLSADDNVFFAAFTGNPPVSQIETGEGGVTAVADWDMPERTVDDDGDGLIDNYIEGNRTADVPADGRYTVILDGCGSTGDIGRYSWMIGSTEVANSAQCRTSALLPEGTVTARLTVTGADGTDSAEFQLDVVDHLIVSLGDSYASGEGNPDTVGDYDCFGLGTDRLGPIGNKFECNANPGHEAVWKQKDCHRSSRAAPALVAQALERDGPRSSVTFIHLACSGATVTNGLIGSQRKEGGWQPPQVSEARRLVNGQTVDAMMLSVGGNDIHFAKIIDKCIKTSNCPLVHVNNFGTDKGRLHAVIQRALGALPAEYDAIDTCLRTGTCAGGSPPFTESVHLNAGTPILVTDYANITKGQDGSYCSDAGAMRQGEYEWADKVVLTGHAKTIHRYDKPLGRDQDLYVSDDGLNRQVWGLHRLSWTPVRTYEHFNLHGYCADEDSWVRSLTQSRTQQGDHLGGFHPNEQGHMEIGLILLSQLRSALQI